MNYSLTIRELKVQLKFSFQTHSISFQEVTDLYIREDEFYLKIYKELMGTDFC